MSWGLTLEALPAVVKVELKFSELFGLITFCFKLAGIAVVLEFLDSWAVVFNVLSTSIEDGEDGFRLCMLVDWFGEKWKAIDRNDNEQNEMYMIC